MAELTLSHLGKSERLRLLTGCVVPRPIALVTTLSTEGKVNAAPFSFFNVLSYQPDIVALGIGDRRGGSPKDTLVNIRARSTFVVNLASETMAEKLNVCGVDFPENGDELSLSGLTPVGEFMDAIPRIAESPVAIGCTLLDELRHDTHSIVLGTVERMWIDDDVLDDDLSINHDRLSLIARLGGPLYARRWEKFSMPRISLVDFRDGRSGD